jgi:hypothetical protein
MLFICILQSFYLFYIKKKTDATLGTVYQIFSSLDYYASAPTLGPGLFCVGFDDAAHPNLH